MSYHKEIETSRAAKEAHDIRQKVLARDRLDRISALLKQRRSQKKEAR